MKQICLDVPPSTNQAYRHASVKGRSIMYKSAEAKAWQAYCKLMCRNWKLIKKPGKLGLIVSFHFKRDRDLDGSMKLLLDALQGVLFDNDSQVYELKLNKMKGDGVVYIKPYLIDQE